MSTGGSATRMSLVIIAVAASREPAVSASAAASTRRGLVRIRGAAWRMRVTDTHIYSRSRSCVATSLVWRNLQMRGTEMRLGKIQTMTTAWMIGTCRSTARHGLSRFVFVLSNLEVLDFVNSTHPLEPSFSCLRGFLIAKLSPCLRHKRTRYGPRGTESRLPLSTCFDLDVLLRKLLIGRSFVVAGTGSKLQVNTRPPISTLIN